ncbi:MAG: hypothetical protein IPI19_16575 [Ignavibacteriales bacterium]|nr:hypothetical protein [Ignavibacteriales bacterium]
MLLTGLPQDSAQSKAETRRAIYLVHLDGKRYEEIKRIADLKFIKFLMKQIHPLDILSCIQGNGFQGKIKLMIGLTEDSMTPKPLQ